MSLEGRGKAWFKQFRLEEDGHIRNDGGKYFDVNGRRDREGESVIVWRKHNHNNQKWDIKYVDPNAKIDYGFEDGKAFIIENRMRSKRVLTFRDGKFVIASRNGSRN
jgi:hypothetical protein